MVATDKSVQTAFPFSLVELFVSSPANYMQACASLSLC